MVGRHQERENLLSYYASNKSEFIAVYGRRRIGKTYLVDEVLGDKICLKVTGMAKVPTSVQLANFYHSLEKAGWEGDRKKTWMDAFNDLEDYLSSLKSKRKVVFIDEMPWMDTQRSHFLSALEHFWNGWAVGQKNIVLIACGSATTWMTNKLINNKAGLHNRLTHTIHLLPFNLHETEEMLHSMGIRWVRKQIVECYMVLGGVPYYLSLLNPKLSMVQNIDNLLFNESGEMVTEFDRLYESLFTNHEYYLRIISALASKAKGMTADEISEVAKIAKGGSRSQALKDLENCHFVRRYNDYSHKQSNPLYQLVDPFTLFYYHFMKKGDYRNASTPWMSLQGKPKYTTWAGYAYEIICLQHIQKIKDALGIGSVNTNVFSWRSDNYDSDKAQIDMVIDRQDNHINLCEIKFYDSVFTINKSYRDRLEKKSEIFREAIASKRPRKSVTTTLITSYGVKENAYSVDYNTKVTMEDLF